ncbi:MAG: hypothetical protein ACRD5R_13065 [Candidatus Acidiferrales bacterium]
MSGTNTPSHPQHGAGVVPAVNPDTLEVAAGTAKEKIEGWVLEIAAPEDLRAALEKAFDYRGDVTITRKDGSKVEGYLFDRRNAATLEESVVRLLPKESGQKIAVSYADISALAFTGRDTAAGKSWEAWVRKYWEKKSSGEQGIGLQPDSID